MWRLVQDCASQVRASFGGVIGFDIPALMMIGSARGIPRDVMADLLPYADRGLRAGLAKLKENETPRSRKDG